jgi:hypothetical protein
VLPRRLIQGRSFLPEILSPEEVARLINAAELSFYRILLMTLYGTRVRRAEVAHLKSAISMSCHCKPRHSETRKPVEAASSVKLDSTLRTGSRGSNSNLAFPRDLHSRSYLMKRVRK